VSIRVLIVDDSPETLQVLALQYRLHPDITVLRTAQCISEALKVCDTTTIDIVSIDVQLHHESGFELCKKVLERYPGVFVTMCSVEAYAKQRSAVQHAGAHYFLEKPIRLEDIHKLFDAYQDFRSRPAAFQDVGSSKDDEWFNKLLSKSHSRSPADESN